MIPLRSRPRFWFACVALLLLFLFALTPMTARVTASDTPPSQQIVQPAAADSVARTLAAAPLTFIENVGQFSAGAAYQIRGENHTIWVAKDALWITMLEPLSVAERDALDSLNINQSLSADTSAAGVNLRLAFVGANPTPRLEPFNPLDTTVSYFKGNEPDKWHADVPVWGGVRYVDLYPGIDLELSGNGGQLQPRLVVRDPQYLSDVHLSIVGAEQISLTAVGGANRYIQLTTAAGKVTLPLFALVRPDGTAVAWEGAPSLSEAGVVTPFAPHGGTQPPQQLAGELFYSTFVGGSNTEYGFRITQDATGNAYVIGRTLSTNFPTTTGVFDRTQNGDYDVIVNKLNPAGSALVYSTFLGGAEQEFGFGIALDASGNAYLTGRTISSNFPTTSGAFDRTLALTDAFVTKLNATGSALLYSTLLGGSAGDVGYSIAVDSAGSAYVTGPLHSSDFPTTTGAFDRTFNGGDYDAFVTKLNAAGNALLYSTYLGGNNTDRGYGITLDTAGNAYVTGLTRSTGFPTTLGAFDTILNGSTDGYVTKLNAAGTALIYSTFLGGGSTASQEEIVANVTLDTGGNAYLTGETPSIDFPTTTGAFDISYNGGVVDSFVTKLNAAGNTLLYSTFLGGVNDDYGYDLVVDAADNVYLAGSTNSSNFPATLGAFDTTYNGNDDVYVTKLNAAGNTLVYSTFLGGVNDDAGYGLTLDAADSVYVTGFAESSSFPTTVGAYDTTHNGGLDVFVTKLDPTNILPTPTPTETSTPTNTPTATVTATETPIPTNTHTGGGFSLRGGFWPGVTTVAPTLTEQQVPTPTPVASAVIDQRTDR